MRLGLVVQRYGADVAGGSETHCREIARRLTPRHDVTVLTSCAKDYVRWANVFSAGESLDEGVRVRRFPVRRPRNLRRFADLSDEVLDGGATPEQQDAWFAANGPDCPALLGHLGDEGHRYDLVLFWTFRYAPSYFGLPLVADRAVLVPTAEEDPAIDLPVLQGFFRRPAGYLFMTPEEAALVSDRAGHRIGPAAIVGIGLEPAVTAGDPSRLAAAGLAERYVLYLGRVDANKGCRTLFDHFIRYADQRADAPLLVVAGPATMPVPPHPRIRALGYVDDALRRALLSHAAALVVPSRYESLSIVLLEAWNQGVPAVVNAGCRVLVGQVRRANGGLFYRSADEFAEVLDYLVSHDREREIMGRQGRAYVDREYRWPTVMARIEGLLSQVLPATAPA